MAVPHPNPPAFPPNQPNPSHKSRHHHHLLPPLVASSASICSFFLIFLLCFRRRLSRKDRTPPPKPPFRFSHSLLRRATSSFSTRLGHGGFGPVFSGTLPTTRQPIAVKLMDSASLQGEREFHNELFFASRLQSRHVVPAIGFSCDRNRRRFMVVYELMHRGNLQDALLHRRCPEMLEWGTRFKVVVDVAKGIQYLHHSCDPPVIHGDIKPSNVLLDSSLSAKVGDFGLARLKSEPQVEIGVSDSEVKSGGLGKEEELVESNGGSVVEEETQSVVTVDEGSLAAEQSPEGFVRIPISETSPEPVEASPSEANFDKVSFRSEKSISLGCKENGKVLKSNSMKDWWWKQDIEAAAVAVAGAGSSPMGENKKVKDYVMEWLGKEISKERPKSDWVAGESAAAASSSVATMEKTEKKKSKRRLEWWMSMDDEEAINPKTLKKEKRRPAREWWKEEYCEELAKKKKKKKKQQQKRNGINSDDDWWARDPEEIYGERKKAKTRKNSRGNNIDSWLDGFSGELFRARRNSHDSAASWEIPKSGVSSTPSMRGTVCYVAPEYGFGDELSEKCDVYSFGVLLLVIVSGRRPLQVTGSPLSEFHKANLLSWARHCARNGKLLDLVDQSIKSLDKDQALLCITIALLCLLKTPSRRPSMKEIVGMLSGELEPPQLPVEYSPSTPSRFRSKARKKGP